MNITLNFDIDDPPDELPISDTANFIDVLTTELISRIKKLITNFTVVSAFIVLHHSKESKATKAEGTKIITLGLV